LRETERETDGHTQTQTTQEEEEGKMRRVGGGWEVFGAMLGFRKDLRKQRRRDEER